MPNFTTDFSPFTVRIRPGKRREELSSKKALALRNPSLTGHCSTSSTTSGTRLTPLYFFSHFNFGNVDDIHILSILKV